MCINSKWPVHSKITLHVYVSNQNKTSLAGVELYGSLTRLPSVLLISGRLREPYEAGWHRNGLLRIFVPASNHSTHNYYYYFHVTGNFSIYFFINFSQSQLMLQRNDTSSNVHVTYSETSVYTGHTFCSLAVLLFVCSSCFLSPFLCWSRRSLSLDKASSSFLPWSTSNTAKRSVIKTLKKQPNYTQTQKLWRSGTAIVIIVARLLYGKNTIMHALKHSIIDWHS